MFRSRHVHIGDPLRRGMGAHGADLLARHADDFAAQAAGEFHVDLLADDAPGQAVKAGGQIGQAQAPARRGECGVAGLERRRPHC